MTKIRSLFSLLVLAWAGTAGALTPVSDTCIPNVARGQLTCWAVAETEPGDSLRGYAGWFTATDYGRPLGYPEVGVAQTIIDVSKALGRSVLGHNPFPYTKKVGEGYVETRPGGYHLLYDQKRPYRYAVPVDSNWLKPGVWAQKQATYRTNAPKLAAETQKLMEQVAELTKEVNSKADEKTVAALEMSVRRQLAKTMPGTAVQQALAVTADSLRAYADGVWAQYRDQLQVEQVTALTAMRSEIDELKARMDAQEQATTALQQTVGGLGQQLTEQGQTIEANAEATQVADAKAGEALKATETLQGEVADNAVAIGGLNARTTNLEGLAVGATRIASKALEDVKALTDAVQQKFNGLNVRTTKLEGVVVEQASRIDSLANRLGGVEGAQKRFDQLLGFGRAVGIVALGLVPLFAVAWIVRRIVRRRRQNRQATQSPATVATPPAPVSQPTSVAAQTGPTPVAKAA